LKTNWVWEHNGNDSLLYSVDLVGAFTRGASKAEALSKIQQEAVSYLRWRGAPIPVSFEVTISQEQDSELAIRDADSDVIFTEEEKPLTREEYAQLKALALRSARDFLTLYNAIPDKNRSCLPERRTFYGQAPRTANEMYLHTKNVNAYYFGEIGVEADNAGTIAECRQRGFEALEKKPDFLNCPVLAGSYGEKWSVRKTLRRFVWHDRIHARAMYRMAQKTFGPEKIPDVFAFNVES